VANPALERLLDSAEGQVLEHDRLRVRLKDLVAPVVRFSILRSLRQQPRMGPSLTAGPRRRSADQARLCDQNTNKSMLGGERSIGWRVRGCKPWVLYLTFPYPRFCSAFFGALEKADIGNLGNIRISLNHTDGRSIHRSPWPLSRRRRNLSRRSPLFDLWRAPLLGYIVTLRLPIEEGEEIVQEVFLALFQHLRRGKSRGIKAGSFELATTSPSSEGPRGRSFCYRLRRAPWRKPRDWAPNRTTACVKQREARLLSVVSALAEQDRCCLHLRTEGLRYREIAEVLGISLGSVALSLGRSLDRLRHADRL
jgi:RNA polymerase sigma-70 factor (ECF subfamily)